MDIRSEAEKGGQPTKYTKAYCADLIDHMSGGYSFDSFAAKIGVHRDTLYEWVKVWPEFKEAKEIAFDACLLFWERLGIEHAVNKSDSFGEGQSSSRSLNSSVYIFNMKARFKWRDKPEGESDVVINNTNTINAKDLSEDELDKLIAEKMRLTKPDDERG